MLEVLLGLFILIIAVGFALLPLIAVVLFFIYIIAPNLLGFETKRNSRRQTVYSKARKNAYQQVKTTPKNTAKPKSAPRSSRSRRPKTAPRTGPPRSPSRAPQQGHGNSAAST